MIESDLPTVTVLYTQQHSVYETLPGVDCWGEDRDARLWPGGTPVVAHPPCAPWGRMRHMAICTKERMDLARHAVACVREWGGVLEHPAGSRLWIDQSLPRPGEGRGSSYTVAVKQYWYGHKLDKWTWLWIVGVPAELLPDIPLRLGRGEMRISHWPCRDGRPELPHKERDATPLALAEWLVAVARLAGERRMT